VLHEGLQANIISEDGLCSLSHTTVSTRGGVRRRRVKLGKQETRLRATGIAHDVPRKREAILYQVLKQMLVTMKVDPLMWELIATHPCITLGLVKQELEVFVTFLFVVLCFAPFCYRFAMEDEDVEEGVKEQDVLRLDGSRIKQDRLRNFLVEGA